MVRGLIGEQWIVLGVLILFTSVVTLINLYIRYLRNKWQTPEYQAKKKARPTTYTNLLHIAKQFNLTSPERDFLWDACKRHPTPNIEYSISDNDEIDSLFKTIYGELSSEDDETLNHPMRVISQAAGLPTYNPADFEMQKELLLSIRDKFESLRSQAGLSSSTVLSDGQELFYISNNQDQHAVTLLENTPDGMFMSLPTDVFKHEIKLEPLSKIVFFFQTKMKVTYMMTSRVIRYEIRRERQMMLISHTTNIKALQRRQHKRIELNIACSFSPVQVISGGTDKETEIIYKPTGKKHEGILIDITGSGCCIKEDLPIKIDQYIYIETKIDGESTDIITGKITSTSKASEQGKFFLHVRFVRMSKATRNRILSRVYDYA